MKKQRDLKSMTIDELWDLHEQTTAKLTRELMIKKARLEERLRKITSASDVIASDHRRIRPPKRREYESHTG
jgi:DNA-binding protein H-NS